MNPGARWTRNGQRRVLFVTYSFPPARTAGTVRTWNIAKYLARSNWLVTVVTPDPRLWRHVENVEMTERGLAEEGIRRLATGHRWRWLAAHLVKCPSERLAWVAGGVGRRLLRPLGIEPIVGWLRAAEQACASLRAGDVDLVLASGPSFSAFLLAHRLARRLRCPYVLDYRDLWSRNLHSPVPAAVRRERTVLLDSAAVTTVSPSWGGVLDRHFGVGPKVHVVSNGYDPEPLDAIPPHPFGHFAIVYTGALWPPKRTISPVMAALRRLDDGDSRSPGRWMFHYYGRHECHVLGEARRFDVTARVVTHGPVPRSDALAAVKGAGAAVVITSVVEYPTPEDNGMVTGKIFEAIGLRTPTLLVAPPTSDANAVAEKSGLARAFAPTDVEGMAAFLSDLRAGKPLEVKDPTAYSWENLVRGLDAVLREIV